MGAAAILEHLEDLLLRIAVQRVLSAARFRLVCGDVGGLSTGCVEYLHAGSIANPFSHAHQHAYADPDKHAHALYVPDADGHQHTPTNLPGNRGAY